MVPVISTYLRRHRLPMPNPVLGSISVMPHVRSESEVLRPGKSI